MSDRLRVLLLGATGLVGGRVVEAAKLRGDLRLFALSRREVPLPPGARIEVLVADPAQWGGAIRSCAPDAVICALGTTWRRAGKDEAAFRAVDQHLVLDAAHAARAAGVRGFVLISSVGADPRHRAFYLRVKGEVEEALAGLAFPRLDILRPGLLRGALAGDRRLLERIGILLSPLVDPFLRKSRARFRSIDAATVAAAALHCAMQDAPGRFVHENAAIARLASGDGR